MSFLDSEYLNSEIAAFKELRDYEEKVLQAMLVSDDTAALILGGSKNDAMTLLATGEGTGKFSIAKLKASKLKDVDATPSSIRYLDPTSSEYARAIAKIRVIVHELGIIVNEEGGTLSGAGTGIKQAADSGNDFAKAVTA